MTKRDRTSEYMRLEDYNQILGDLITSVTTAVRTLPNRVSRAMAQANSTATSEQDRKDRISLALDPELAAIMKMNARNPRWPRVEGVTESRPKFIAVATAHRNYRNLQETFLNVFVDGFRAKVLSIKATEPNVIAHQMTEFYRAGVDDVVAASLDHES